MKLKFRYHVIDFASSRTKVDGMLPYAAKSKDTILKRHHKKLTRMLTVDTLTHRSQSQREESTDAWSTNLGLDRGLVRWRGLRVVSVA